MTCHVGDHEEGQIIKQGKGHRRVNLFFLSKVLIKENVLSCCGKILHQNIIVHVNNREKTADHRASNCVSELTEGLH